MHIHLPAIGFFITASTFVATARQPDSLRIRMEYMGAVSEQEYQPLWLSSDKFGAFEEASAGLVRAGFFVPYKQKPVAWAIGLDVLHKPFKTTTVQQAFLKAKMGFLELKAGKIEETAGIDSTLSSGSLLRSANAAPIPAVSLSVPSFVAVPFTKGLIEVKGHISHSWMEKEAVVERAFLHEKAFAMRLGGEMPVKVYGGLTHVAFWGGRHAVYGQLPDSFKDFLIVLRGENGGENSLAPEAQNALGNHLGVVEYGADVLLGDYNLLVYNQIPFEDGSGIGIVRRDGLRGITIKKRKKNGYLNALTYEFISTTYQSGPSWLPPAQPGGEPVHNFRGNDNFYNNWLYRNGWTYRGRVIGSPLFHTWSQAVQHYGLEFSERPGIANNRIQAHHLGVEGNVIPSLKVTTYITWSRNYGTYENPYRNSLQRYELRQEGQKDYYDQWYLMTEVAYRMHPSLEIVGRAALDYGELSDNYGFSFSLVFDQPFEIFGSG